MKEFRICKYAQRDRNMKFVRSILYDRRETEIEWLTLKHEVYFRREKTIPLKVVRVL